MFNLEHAGFARKLRLKKYIMVNEGKMSSKTLRHIAEHMHEGSFLTSESLIEFPFNVEEFCRENDEILKQKDDKIKEFASEIVRLMAINKGIK